MFVEINAVPENSVPAVMKRWIDICGAALSLTLFSPLFLLVALLIQFETPGKVFYYQERIGRGGKRFLLLKFITMRDFPQESLHHLIQIDSKIRLEYERFQKLSDDPRLTRIGRYLRRSSLDELPQLWNVLKGEMSLVGARPFLPEQLPLYGPAFLEYQERRPGMTGLWQVSGRNHLSFAERVHLDEKYAREWSLWLDIKILLVTPWIVLRQRGAY